MNPRTTGILLVVAVALGAFVYLYEIRGGEQRLEAEALAKRLFPGVESGAVEAIALRTTDGRDARVARSEGVWRVETPVQALADATSVDAMASALAEIQSEGAIDDPQALSVYGLDDETRLVRFRAGGTDHELRIGRKTPLGSNSYAATGADDTVYTVATFRTNAFEKALDDLREKRPIRFDRTAIDRIEVDWQGGGVVLEKRGDAWRLLAPLESAADESTVETLLSDLAFLRATGFVDEPPPDAETGLERPAWKVALLQPASEEGAAPLRHELRVGNALDAASRAARGAEPVLYRIPEERYESLPRRVAAFRFKELANFVATDATRFEIVFHDEAEGQSRVETITGTRDDAGWTTSPEAMAAGNASRLVAELARLEAADIAAESMGADELAGVGLAPPNAALRVFGAPPEGAEQGPLLAEVHLGTLEAERIYARVPDREIVYQLDYELAEHLPVSLEAFRNRFVSKEIEGAAAVEPIPMEAVPTPPEL